MDLHGTVGNAADHLAGEILGLGAQPRDALARLRAPRRVADQRPCDIVLGPAVGQHRLDELELGDRPAELAPLQRKRQRFADQPVGKTATGRGKVEPAAVEHLHGRPEPLPLDAADQRVAGDAAVLEDDVADRRTLLPHLSLGRTEPDPRIRRLDHERRNAGGTRFPATGSRHDREDVGDRRVGDEALGAV